MSKKPAPTLSAVFTDDAALAPVERATPKSRNGKSYIAEGESLVAAKLPVEYARTLRIIAAEENTTTRALVREALDLFLKSRGRDLA